MAGPLSRSTPLSRVGFGEIAMTLRMLVSVVVICSVPMLRAAEPRAAETKSPPIEQPTLFHTKEADAIVAQMRIFPADNAWHGDVSKWPVHPNSRAIVASIGEQKPLRYN